MAPNFPASAEDNKIASHVRGAENQRGIRALSLTPLWPYSHTQPPFPLLSRFFPLFAFSQTITSLIALIDACQTSSDWKEDVGRKEGPLLPSFSENDFSGQLIPNQIKVRRGELTKRSNCYQRSACVHACVIRFLFSNFGPIYIFRSD